MYNLLFIIDPYTGEKRINTFVVSFAPIVGAAVIYAAPRIAKKLSSYFNTETPAVKISFKHARTATLMAKDSYNNLKFVANCCDTAKNMAEYGYAQAVYNTSYVLGNYDIRAGLSFSYLPELPTLNPNLMGVCRTFASQIGSGTAIALLAVAAPFMYVAPRICNKLPQYVRQRAATPIAFERVRNATAVVREQLVNIKFAATWYAAAKAAVEYVYPQTAENANDATEVLKNLPLALAPSATDGEKVRKQLLIEAPAKLATEIPAVRDSIYDTCNGLLNAAIEQCSENSLCDMAMKAAPYAAVGVAVVAAGYQLYSYMQGKNKSETLADLAAKTANTSDTPTPEQATEAEVQRESGNGLQI